MATELIEIAQRRLVRSSRRAANEITKLPQPSLPHVQKLSPPRSLPEPGPARFRTRHWALLASFFLFVVLPGAFSIAYLYLRAADQYHSVVGFSVRSEDASSPLELLGAFTTGSESGANDADILVEYVNSQQIVEEIMAELDLVEIYNKAPDDFVFTLGTEPTIEDVHWYWEWMLSVSYDSGTQILEIETRAFTPEDAHAVAQAIVRKCAALVNALSIEARNDAIRFAKQDLNEAEQRLRSARRKLREFRDLKQLVDPTADLEQRMTLISALEMRLIEAITEKDILEAYAQTGDTRLQRLERQIAVIRQRIDEERAELGTGTTGDEAELFSSVVGTFEELMIDREFAEQAYAAVLASYEEARSEARRTHRYLATHIGPTRSQEALYPRRLLLSFVGVLFLLTFWLVLVLIAYNARDRR